MKGCSQLSYTSTVDSYNSNFQSLQVSLMTLTDILTVLSINPTEMLLCVREYLDQLWNDNRTISKDLGRGKKARKPFQRPWACFYLTVFQLDLMTHLPEKTSASLGSGFRICHS